MPALDRCAGELVVVRQSILPQSRDRFFDDFFGISCLRKFLRISDSHQAR
ncbi:MAG: hypothetical protein U0X93_11725 [Anaerolineales bacterium]